MSATLRVADFTANTALFTIPPPVISIPARQHPVTVHFARRTQADYVSAAIQKASRIHTRLPPGGILIFLTGQNEIQGVCRKLEERYSIAALRDRKRHTTGKPTIRGNMDGEAFLKQAPIPIQGEQSQATI
jgi:ATP-dependent RNA helicase DHX37/DHR1